MDLLQGVDIGSGVLLGLGLACLCGAGLLALFVLQIFSGFFEIFFGFFSFILEMVSGGPLGFCGCFVIVGLLGICGVLMFSVLAVLPNCGTENAVNLCRLLGYQ